jgi:hypothetical protein
MCNTKHTLLEEIKVISCKTKRTKRSTKLFIINKPKNEFRSRIIIMNALLLLLLLNCQSQWPRGLRCRSTAARLLRSWVRIQPGARMFICCVCCVLSGRGPCNELITRPEESYRLWRVVVCDQETSWLKDTIAWAGLQCQRK